MLENEQTRAEQFKTVMDRKPLQPITTIAKLFDGDIQPMGQTKMIYFPDGSYAQQKNGTLTIGERQ